MPDGLRIHWVGEREIKTCYGATCKTILTKIKDWASPNLANGQAQIFWLSGPTGSGKSTIVKTIATWADQKGLLGYCRFCDREHRTNSSKPSYLIPYIAYRISMIDPSLATSVTKALVEVGALYQGIAVPFQAQNPVVNSMDLMHGHSNLRKPTLIVIDALDECDDPASAQMIISFLSKLAMFNRRIRIFISSRPEQHIQAAFDEVVEPCPSTVIRCALEEFVEASDIEEYLREEFKKLSEPNRPNEDDINLLVAKCGRLFVYASTASRFILEGRAPESITERLKIILGTDVGKAPKDSPNKQLDNLYLCLLKKAIGNDSSKSITRLRMVLGAMSLTHEPQTVDCMAKMLDEDEEYLKNMVKSSGATNIIAYNDSFGLFPNFPHVSLPELLTDAERCVDEMFLIDASCLETYLFRRSLNIIIDGLAATSREVNKGFRDAMRYACQHWARHLEKALHKDAEAAETLCRFVQHCLLIWLVVAKEIHPESNVDDLYLAMETARKWAVCDNKALK
ncbi:hypothetical protein SCHPADRAFT_509128 [Schizopora paradoxa]|uniref:Nephrocystin 3-like N-terminal domain-containing protein n=1 Tax=Schizopora paradoxa TaxID=27342 RepID=A0A0H2RGD2_9AGAM|nr:hypothetical protein SCHPADRAFT_509128 [Schizopora paradoxa]